MKKLLLSSLLLLHLVSFCQTEDSTINAARKRQIEDSLTALLNNIGDDKEQAATITDKDKTIGESENPGLDYFVRMAEREKAEQKKTAVFRIILGVLLLGILVIGLTRKVKK